jgi:DNA polymerase IV
MRAELEPLAEKVWSYCDATGVRGRTVTLKVQYSDFQIITRSRSLAAPVANKAVLAAVTRELLTTLHPIPKCVRLLGVSLSSLSCDQAGGDPQMILAL